MDKNTIDELASRLAAAVPGDVRALREDIERNFKGLLTAGLDKMDLVTREEFDIQRKVLERTREKLDRLEQQLAELQARSASRAEGAAGDSG